MKELFVIVNFWNDNLKVGIQDYKNAIALINGEVIYLKSEVNSGTLRYRNKKIIFTYNNIKKGITHRKFKLKQILPF